MIAGAILMLCQALSGHDTDTSLKVIADYAFKNPSNVVMCFDGSLRGTLVATGNYCRLIPPGYKPVALRKFADGRYEIPVNSMESVTYERNGSDLVALRFYTIEGEFISKLDLPQYSGEAELHDSKNVLFPWSGRWYRDGKWFTIPPIPGANTRRLRGLSEDGTLLAACSNIIPNAQEGTGRFALFRVETGWRLPSIPKGYRHAIAEGITQNGYALLQLSKRRLAALPGYLLDGQEDGPEGSDSFKGSPRFYKDGKYSGATPPDLDLGKDYKRYRQFHYAEGKWGNIELYMTNIPVNAPDVHRCIPRFRINGKWFLIHQLVKGGKPTFFRDLSYSSYWGSFLHLYEESKSSNKYKQGRVVVLKLNFVVK